MTATMRRNYELFGSYLCFDMMKRDINTLLWPYTAITMLDEAKNVCVACEGIVCGEKTDMYSAQAKFLSKYATSRQLSSVQIVAADGFFDQETIIDLGFINANFIMDHWHLFDSGLLKIFGKSGYDKLKSHLVQMIRADSQDRFDEIYQSGIKLLSSQKEVDGELVQNFHEFAAQKEHYAEYYIAKIPGNRGCRGSTIAEVNHSSVLSYLNNGEKGINRYREHPVLLVRDLMGRQQTHSARINNRLHRSIQIVMMEIDQLLGNPDTHLNRDLILAARFLNKETYLRYKSHALRASLYKCHQVTDSSTKEDFFKVQHLVNSDAPPRMFSAVNGRCDCTSRVSEQDMCVHEIVAYDGFRKELFLPRHLRRECVTGSLDGWTPKSHDIINQLLGYSQEILVDGSAKKSEETSLPTFQMTEGNPYASTNEACSRITDKRVGINPYKSADLDNVLRAVMLGYNKMSRSKKEDVSLLVLEMQNLLTDGKATPLSRESVNDNVTISVPTVASLRNESKKRIQSTRETHGKIEFQKYIKSVQALGMRQTLSRNHQQLEVLGKSQRKCSFCSGGHIVSSCQRLAGYQSTMNLYKLSTKWPSVYMEMIIRLKETIPVALNTVCSGILGKIHGDFKSTNFIIHEASTVSSFRYGHVEDLNYRITMLNKNGMPDSRMTNTWINGPLMAVLIAHPNKSLKYVFDETINRQNTWYSKEDLDRMRDMELTNLSQLSSSNQATDIDESTEGAV